MEQCAIMIDNARRRQDKLPEIAMNDFHLILTGNPGVGKTTIARVIAKMFLRLGAGKVTTDTVVEVQAGELLGQNAGECHKNTREKIDAAKGGVLIVDEAPQLNDGQDWYALSFTPVLLSAR